VWAEDAGHEPVHIRPGHRAGFLWGVPAVESAALHRMKSDVDRGFEGSPIATAVDLVAVCDVAAPECGPADFVPANDEAPRAAGGQRQAGGGDAGYRHDRAPPLWASDGRAQELQPEAQGKEKLSADVDVYSRDARILVGRVAQWTRAYRPVKVSDSLR